MVEDFEAQSSGPNAQEARDRLSKTLLAMRSVTASAGADPGRRSSVAVYKLSHKRVVSAFRRTIRSPAKAGHYERKDYERKD